MAILDNLQTFEYIVGYLVKIAWPSSNVPLVADEPRRLTESDLFPLADILRPAAPKWKEIGGALGIINSDLSIIENKPTLILEGVPGYFREMLSAWLKRAPPNHPWPTIQELVDAVQRSGHESLAVEVQNYKINITTNHF